MLRRLGREHRPAAVAAAIRRCRADGIATMVDLLLGSPGETLASISRSIEAVQRMEPDCVGVALGVRVYPGTELARRLRSAPAEGLVGGAAPGEPLYYLDPAVAAGADRLLQDKIGADRRFFYAPAGPQRDYNYADNRTLVEAIARGQRGAYWDILRRLQEG